MSKIKISFELGKIEHCLWVIPNIQITHYKGEKSFSVAFTWLKVGFGWIFSKEIEL